MTTNPAHSEEADQWYLTGGGVGAQMMRYRVRMRELEAISERINDKIEKAMELDNQHKDGVE